MSLATLACVANVVPASIQQVQQRVSRNALPDCMRAERQGG